MNKNDLQRSLAIIGSILLLISVFLPYQVYLAGNLVIINTQPLIGVLIIADGIFGLIISLNKTELEWVPGIIAFTLLLPLLLPSTPSLKLLGQFSYGIGVIIIGAALLLISTSRSDNKTEEK